MAKTNAVELELDLTKVAPEAVKELSRISWLLCSLGSSMGTIDARTAVEVGNELHYRMEEALHELGIDSSQDDTIQPENDWAELLSKVSKPAPRKAAKGKR